MHPAGLKSTPTHGPKRNPNFRDITRNVEENEILHKIFRVVSRFPHYISFHITENRLPGFNIEKTTVKKWLLSDKASE